MKYLSFLLVASATLAGCASPLPSHIVLSPDAPIVQVQTQSHIPISLDTIDTRKANFIVRFNDADKAARLVSPNEAPRGQLAQIFSQGFTQAGYQLQPDSNKHIQIQLEKMLTDVNENTWGFEANSEIIINVIITKGNDTLTKRYRKTGLLKGPLRADFASLELEINKLSSELTQSIINDAELNQFIQS